MKDFGLFDILQQVYKSGQLEYFPLSFYKDDKHFGWRENWVYKLPNGDIVAVYNDVTERKNVEEIIQTLKHSIDQAGFGIMIASLDGVLLYVNEGARHMWGFSKADKLKGKPIDSGFAETEKEKIATAMENVNKVGSWSGEVVAKRKDGSHFDAQVSASLIKDFNGTSLHIVAYSVDVTEKTRARKTLNSSTSQLALINEKLSVVGRLTRHDSRNKLAAISANLYLAKKHLSKNHEALKYLVSIESDITQIDRILEFSRVYEQLGMEELSKIDVGKSFDTAVSLHHNLDKITFVNACNGVSVLADSLLDTLFYNLIDNSVAHGEKVSKISIYSETLYDDSLRLVYEDNGVGIAKKEKEKIFQEGYGKGTGMGLHMIKIMCKIYGFTIKETGEKGKGAQFEIQIPKTKYSLLNVKRNSKVEKVFSEI